VAQLLAKLDLDSLGSGIDFFFFFFFLEMRKKNLQVMAATNDSEIGLQWRDVAGVDGKLSGTMIVMLHYARNLPKMDAGFGKVDAYFKISAGKKSFKSKTKSKDYNPKYDESFRVSLDGLTAVPPIVLEAYDKDALSKDDFIGRASLSPLMLPELNVRVDLQDLAKKPSNDAGAAFVVVSMAWMPSYSYAARVLRERNDGRAFEGSKKLTHLKIRATGELGAGVAVIAEFEKDTFDLHLVQEEGAASVDSPLWTELSLGGKKKYKVRRQQNSEAWTISDIARVVSSRKLDDLDCWTDFAGIEMRAFEVDEVLSTTMDKITVAHGWQPGVRADYAKAKAMLNDIETDDKSQSLYFPLRVDGIDGVVAYLKSDFDSDNIDRAMLLTEIGAAANIVVDIAHHNTKKRVEHHWPKTTTDSGLGKDIRIVSRVSIDDIPMPCYQNHVTVRLLRRRTEPRVVRLIDLLPIFRPIRKSQIKKNKHK
jgi:C2 domain